MEVRKAALKRSPSRFMNELLKPGFDLIVGQECHVARMSHRKAIPVSEQRGPGLGWVKS